MSKFKSLPTDNSKTSAPAGSIFYRPRSTLTDEYKNARIEQQQKQKKLLSKIGGSNAQNNANKKFKKMNGPIRRIAVGRNHKITLSANKPNTNKKMELLNSYKAKFCDSKQAKIDISKLPPNTFKCSLFKKSLQCNRAYIGHFVGSKGPKFSKSKIHSIREQDLQTKLERIQYDKSLNSKKRAELISKLKFSTTTNADDESTSVKNKNLEEREYHFEFVEGGESASKWLGKPKEENKNYSYVIMEWLPCSNRSGLSATVYPAQFIEFNQSEQLISDNFESSEYFEKRHRAHIEKWKKKQCEKSMMEKLGNLFGHNADGKNAKHKRPKADEMSLETKLSLKNEFLQKDKISDIEMKMLADLLGKEMYSEFCAEFEDLRSVNLAVQVGDDRQNSLIDERVLSKRIKKGKTRGTMDELNDYDEVMSDDEDERNMNNYDVMDENEEDVWSDDEDESEQNELFKKMEQNLAGNLTEKEYEVPIDKNKKKSLFDDESEEDENENEVWNISEDEDDEDEDAEDDNVKIVQIGNTKKRKLENKNDGKDANKKSKKRRKLNNDKVDSTKLREELTEIITKILKKFADGLDMRTLWTKVTATLSYDAKTIRNMMGVVIKDICRRNTTQIETKDGKKDVHKYLLKKKLLK